MIESFVRQAEEQISTDLRVSKMIQIDIALITTVRVALPDDWREADFVRIVDYGPLEYMSRPDFYAEGDEGLLGYYTTSGLYMMFGGSPNTLVGKTVELHYFGDVPQLTEVEGSSWLADDFQSLLIPATMVAADEQLEENTTDWGGKYSARLDKLNDEYRRSRSSGSKLHRRGRSFG
jgi:hypothetical protein